ncbi:MAG: 4-alpha-glucanotransferase, partial [candidate division WOR-3 bacterium]|nr:4-alpha-glucanotransferase [candidate division WOR-3 bacterium]
MKRGSGILLHITSLPGAYGIGDFGPAAYRFVDFLVKT